MPQEIEIEYKNLVTIDEYQRMLDAYPFSKDAKKQCNYYFETPDRKLGQHGCALRIRQKGDTYTVTLKEPHPDGLLETHDTISRDTCQHWLDGNIIPQTHTKKQLHHIGISSDLLHYVGCLETIRHETTYDGALLVLDQSMYNGRSDYELEVEAPTQSHGARLFHSIIDELNIPERETPNKIQRFFASLPAY